MSTKNHPTLFPFHMLAHIKLKECRMRNKTLSRIQPYFAYAKTKAQISCAATAQLISAFVFAIQIVQLLFLLNPKFQVSSPFL